MSKGVDYRTMPIQFSNVHFNEEVEIKADDPLKLAVMIQKGNHYFEVGVIDTRYCAIYYVIDYNLF